MKGSRFFNIEGRHNMVNEQQIKELLGRVNDLLEIKQKMPSVPGKKFNIFSVLDREHKEVTTHCRLIGEFLDKNGSHGMGDVFLREFFPIVLELDYPKNEPTWLWWQYLPSGNDDEKNVDDETDINFRSCLGRYEDLLDDAKRGKLIDEIVDKVKKQLHNILETGLPE